MFPQCVNTINLHEIRHIQGVWPYTGVINLQYSSGTEVITEPNKVVYLER